MDAISEQLFENCSACGRETAHSVSIELRRERTEGDRAKYSREPYRVSVCDDCGTRERVCMNDR